MRECCVQIEFGQKSGKTEKLFQKFGLDLVCLENLGTSNNGIRIPPEMVSE